MNAYCELTLFYSALLLICCLSLLLHPLIAKVEYPGSQALATLTAASRDTDKVGFFFFGFVIVHMRPI